MESNDDTQNNPEPGAAGGGGGSGESSSSHIRLSRLTDRGTTHQPADDRQPLSTQEALVRLNDDINEGIILMKREYANRRLVSWIGKSISFKSELSKMRWPSVMFMSAQAIAHFIVAFVLNVENLATKWVGFQGFLLFLLLLFNLTVNLWDTQLRFKELLMKAEQIRHLVWRCSQDKHLLAKWNRHNWKSSSSSNLFIPKSPCVHHTLTYRDQSCLNLPDYLLVRGDIIHLYPGEKAPCDCLGLTATSGGHNNRDKTKAERVLLNDGDIFLPIGEAKNIQENPPEASKLGDEEDDDVIAHARMKKANDVSYFLVLTTPHVNSLRISLQRSNKRPVNSI